jgi:methionine aminotransferase
MASETLRLQSKLPDLPTTIFTVMSRMANEYNAINLSQGFPNFDMSQELISLVNKAMVEGYNQYAPMPGHLGLRQVISQKYQSLYNVTYNPESEITITAGATQAIFTALTATIHKGDEVILFKPAYDCYEPTIELLGAKPIAIQLNPQSFEIDWEEVEARITPRTRMIIINTPHNPTGTVIDHDSMKTLENLLEGTDILLLSDEVYEHIIFDALQHQTAALFPGLFERTFITGSFGKTFHNTGWKTGYCLAPKNLMEEFKKVHQFNVFSVNHPVQVGLASYLKNPETYLSLGAFYQQKRDLFLDLIKDSRFSFEPSKGTYFQILGYDGISDESDFDFATRMTQELKLASIPVSAFNIPDYDTKALRFCFAKTEDSLRKAAAILNAI